MKEIEVKILDIDKEKIVTKLLDLGAKKVFEGDMNIEFFDYPDKRLKNENKILRLRTKGDQAELTFKHALSREGVKIAEEIETHTDDFETTREIIEQIGLKLLIQTQKHRESYLLQISEKEKIQFEFDTHKGIPTFLEIEASSVELVETYVNKLGFNMQDTTTMNGKQVMEKYGQKLSKLF
ncbi:class IV adenylate cyclase [Candidatus Woesearchaeota archaeon]|mgnify:CR=1 FL=1|jgi:adenylate cyclase, class 2|nr:class IV adenylate cyclase [Candidatus Woesearchaeota archaeon]